MADQTREHRLTELEALSANLETDLSERIQDEKLFLDDLVQERNFLFDKLAKLEEVRDAFPPSSLAPIFYSRDPAPFGRTPSTARPTGCFPPPMVFIVFAFFFSKTLGFVGLTRKCRFARKIPTVRWPRLSLTRF
jgi:uncharacterized coiled-coil protein SlyX